jgi:poly(3-hydroxybutyrate) depolymerase
MAARGYVVLYTNPRGSTSYGQEFGNLIYHAYPGDDFYDLNSGVDAVLAKGYVDPEQLYVTGGSGGGVLTCWVIGHTPRRSCSQGHVSPGRSGPTELCGRAVIRARSSGEISSVIRLLKTEEGRTRPAPGRTGSKPWGTASDAPPWRLEPRHLACGEGLPSGSGRLGSRRFTPFVTGEQAHPRV